MGQVVICPSRRLRRREDAGPGSVSTGTCRSWAGRPQVEGGVLRRREEACSLNTGSLVPLFRERLASSRKSSRDHRRGLCSRTFMVSSLTFKSLTRFKLIFVSGTRSGPVLFLCTWTPRSPGTIYRRHGLFPLCVLGSPVPYWRTVHVGVSPRLSISFHWPTCPSLRTPHAVLIHIDSRYYF